MKTEVPTTVELTILDEANGVRFTKRVHRENGLRGLTEYYVARLGEPPFVTPYESEARTKFHEWSSME
jgi:hypothetical protein